MTAWSEMEAALGEFLECHGERPRPYYPVTALYHVGLWDLGGPWPVPPTQGNAPQRWFVTHQPVSGLPAQVYNLVRYRERPASRRWRPLRISTFRTPTMRPS